MVTTPSFYNLKDQGIYAAGDFFIPQERYRAAPYNVNQPNNPDDVPAGIPTVYQPQGNMTGGALQAGDINYDSFAKAGFDAYANRQPTPLVDDLYQSKVDKTFMGFPSYRQQELTGPDMGEYIGSGTDIPLELTTAGKIQESLGGIKEGLGSFADKVGGFGPISMVLSKMDKFDTLPALDQQFIKQSMGYRGPTVFGENTGGGYVDPFGVNVRSAFGNYAEKVRDDFSSLGDSLSGRLSEKYGATFNSETGMFESEDEEAAAKANKMTKMMRAKYNFRQKQIQQQEFDKKIAEQQEAARRADIQRIQSSLDRGGYDSTSSRPDRDRGSVTEASAAASKGVGGGGYTASDSNRDAARGRYMMGGLADLVDIYD